MFRQYSIHDAKILGQGAFSLVKEAQNTTNGRAFACKIIEKQKYWNSHHDSGRGGPWVEEIAIMSRLTHPGIGVFDLTCSETGGPL